MSVSKLSSYNLAFMVICIAINMVAGQAVSMLKLPIFGILFRKVAISKFTRTLSTLIKSGVPILAALEIVGKTSGNRVVEIAIDGVQRSSRYPGGVALRFARVKGYRPDKSAAEADTIQSLRELLR